MGQVFDARGASVITMMMVKAKRKLHLYRTNRRVQQEMEIGEKTEHERARLTSRRARLTITGGIKVAFSASADSFLSDVRVQIGLPLGRRNQ